MDVKKLANYILSDRRYDSRTITYALETYELSFVRLVFSELKKGRLVYESHHFRRIIEDIFDYYEDDETTFSRIDRVLAKIEPLIPRMTPEELSREEVELVRRAARRDLVHYKRLLRQLPDLEKLQRDCGELEKKLGAGESLSSLQRSIEELKNIVHKH